MSNPQPPKDRAQASDSALPRISDENVVPGVSRVEMSSIGGLGGSLAWLPAAGSTLDLRAHAARQAELGDHHFRQGRFAQALPLYLDAVKGDPQDGIHHYRLAVCAWMANDVQHVEQHLLEAHRLLGDHSGVAGALGRWYYEAADLDRALVFSGRAVELAPATAEFRITRSIVLESVGRYDEAWKLIEPLLGGDIADTRLCVIYARLAPRFGHDEKALEVIVRRLATPGLAPIEISALHFSASALYDKTGRYDQAFEHAHLGHASSRRAYDPEFNRRLIGRRIDYFTPSRFYSLPRATHGNRRPVFIIGMPRSGTSLVEQILSSHPQVHGGGELSLLTRIANHVEPRAGWAEGEYYPEFLDLASVRTLNRIAQQYLSGIEQLNATATYVTDKMPQNFLFLGLIALLFPDCHVIHCRRHPLDTCLSCYMTCFAQGHDYTHDLAHLAAFYRDYRLQMHHWKTTLNFPMLEVRYEEVVSDLEGQARRLLEFLALPWDDRCLEFHRNSRPVITASSNQVRRPIYASSVGRWKHYARHLQGLKARLQEYGVEVEED